MKNGRIEHIGKYDELMQKGVELSNAVQLHHEKINRVKNAKDESNIGKNIKPFM